MGVKGLKEQNVTKIDSKQNLMQILQGERKKLPKRLNKRIWAQQNFSASLSNITAHRQKGEIHIYISI